MKNLRKFFAVSVMALTIFSMSGISPVKANAQAGDLIKKDGLSTVYYLGADGKRYVFPHDSVYFSWYKDFSGVVTVSATELSSYPLGANVVMRPGTKLVKITTDPSVYAVEANGVLRKIQSEADAIALYGSMWAQRVIDVADSFFTNYTIGTPLTAGAIPAGSLVKVAGNSAIYYYDGSTYRNIATEAAFNANRFDFSNVITVSAIGTMGAAITGAEETFTKTSQSGVVGGVQPGQGTGLTASLSSNTPTSINIPAGVSAEFLKFNLTASNDGNISIASIKLSASDLGDPTYIDDVTLYDGLDKIGTSKNINSSREAMFNFATPLVVNAGTTKTITVKASIEATQTGNFILGIAAAADIVATGATISGSFPIKGNSMSAVTSVAVGDVSLSLTGTTDTSNNFGEDNVVLAGFDLTANHEDILIQSLKLKNGGTNSADVVSNLKMYFDGTEVATGVYSDGYYTFTFSNKEIVNGDTVSVEVKGDLGVTNVNDTVNLYIKNKTDFLFVGKTYGFSAPLVDADFQTFDAASDGIVVTLTVGDFALDMDKSSTTGTPAKDVKAGDNDVVLATLTFKSNNENATIEQIVDNGGNDFEITGTGLTAGEIENVEMVDVSTGGVYDITATFSVNKWTLSMTDEIPLVKGVVKKFLIRADMSDTVGTVIDNNDTLKVVLDALAMSVKGDVSDAYITDITPSSVDSAITTIKDASLTWTPVALTNKTVVGGAADVEIYHATLKAGTSDSVNLQSVKLSTTLNNKTAFADANITKMDMYLDGKLIKTLSNDITEATAGTDGVVTFNSMITTGSANVIGAGKTVDLVVKATFASTLSPTGNFNLEVSAEGDITSRSVTGNKLITEDGTFAGDCRLVTLTASGDLKVELLINDVKADESSYVLAGSETPANRYMGELKFTTYNEPVKVTRLSLKDNSTATSADLKEVKLVKFVGGVMSVVATQTVAANGDVVFDPFNVVFPADQSTSLFIVAVAKGINVDGDASATATYGRAVQYNIDPAADGIEANGDNSGTAITMVTNPGAAVIAGEWSEASVVSNTNVITGSLLSSISNPMADGALVSGLGKIIGKYTFVFDNGANRDTSNGELKAIFDKLVLTFAKSTAVVITNVRANIDGTSTKVDADTLATLGNGATTGTATWNALTLQGLAGDGAVDGTVTLVITADVAPTAAVGEYVQTSIADLVGASDFNYIGDGLAGSAALTTMYLPVTEVLGATLQE